ncbi:MAG: sulfatase-like hydrolase/transferase [Puniceicoccales bacterium]|nr:sulfatase-like hydrolase/transferase [Puniceicoccales bacterium]
MMNKSLNCGRGQLGTLLRKIFWLFVLFSLVRLLFLVCNHSFFTDVSIGNIGLAFLVGLRVDLCLISLICAPTIALYLLPMKRLRFVIFLADLWCFLAVSAAVIVNVFDFGYFPFTFRRLGGEIFGQGELLTESFSVCWSALLLYWYLVLCGAVLLCCTWYISFKITPRDGNREYRFCVNDCLRFLLSAVLLTIGIRGGFQIVRPFRTVQLPIFVGTGNEQFIANNSFLNVIHTKRGDSISNFQFFQDQNELNKLFTPIHSAKNFSPLHGKFAGKNVVILILESFTAQNVGFLDREYKDYPGRTFTPFLDELLAKSLYFDGFANGTVSVDALTSVLMGVPPLLESAFAKSAFMCNKVDPMPEIMKRMGYSVLFLHGGRKNACEFDTARAYSGIEKYVCKRDFFERYPQISKSEVMVHWGIYDEEWLQFVSEVLSETKPPFCAVVFTLSSHTPFAVPKRYKGTFPTGEHPLQKVTAYSDFALRRFFESAQKTDWYGDTIFILCADHTSCATERYYQKSLGGYSIPFAIFDPSGELHGKSNMVAQQVDIMATVLDLIGYDEPYFSFGHSLFDEKAPHFAVSYRNGIYQIVTDKYVLQFNNNSVVGFYLRSDFLLEHNLIHSAEYEHDMMQLEAFFKAFLQQYSYSLRMNKMTCE